MSADLVALALHVAQLESRLQRLEDGCAGCPGSVEPQDFTLDVFPTSHQHQIDDFDDYQGAPR